MNLYNHPISQITEDNYIGIYSLQTEGLGLILIDIREQSLIMRWKLPQASKNINLTMYIKLPEDFELKRECIFKEIEKILNDEREQNIKHLNKCLQLDS